MKNTALEKLSNRQIREILAPVQYYFTHFLFYTEDEFNVNVWNSSYKLVEKGQYFSMIPLYKPGVQQITYVTLLQVHYSDRQNGKECMTCLTLSPVQMTFQGIGSSIEASHDQV